MSDQDDLYHYGTPRHSGRYPWGSGKDPQRSRTFLSEVAEMEKRGMSRGEIAEHYGLTAKQLASKKTIALNAVRAADMNTAYRLREKGMSLQAIGERMGKNESSVRALLDASLKERSQILNNVADVLRDQVSKNKYIDVGTGVDVILDINRTKLDAAISMLEDEGYKVYWLKEATGTGKYTSVRVLVPPETDYRELLENRDKVRVIYGKYSEDGGRTILGLEPVNSVSSDRVMIRYEEDGGKNKDGVIELRRGVDELSLGEKAYAQVRIGVDGKYFMKGMAIYGDDMPPGIDIIYNTNKSKDVPREEVFKKMDLDDPDNPFGSIVRQRHYIDANGERRLSAINTVGYTEGSGEEGSWGEWSKTLSSQMLSKQPLALAKRQLGLDRDIRTDEFEEIMSLTNPAVKKRLLNSFADDCDSAAVHLKAAALPRQSSHVILPVNSLKENEVYAPNYNPGELVALIRYPHGGTFEIPQLVVNNRNPEAQRIMGKNPKDAIGINPKVAERLSGADFDGDTVLVIPNSSGAIKSSPPLKGLKNFDPKAAYPKYEGMPRMTSRQKGIEMGKISNLITDMTIQGAPFEEIARAVRHSMVVIDAEKHHLNYKLSYENNGIAALKKKYQGDERAGAHTLISRASAEKRVPVRKEISPDPVTGEKRYKSKGETYVALEPDKDGPFRINPKTGKKVYLRKKPVMIPDTDGPFITDPKTGKKTYLNKKEKLVERTELSTRMAEEKDAYNLSSGTRMESVYADYANGMKALANRARKAALETPSIVYSRSAREVYAKEVAALKAKLNMAFINKPLERQAQTLANTVVAAKRREKPDMEASELKKIKAQALQEMRARVGAKKNPVVITDREWEAIQAGAITNNLLSQVLLNTDLDAVRERALPRTYVKMSPSKIARGRSMLLAGYTRAEVAQALGVSVTTIENTLE